MYLALQHQHINFSTQRRKNRIEEEETLVTTVIVNS